MRPTLRTGINFFLGFLLFMTGLNAHSQSVKGEVKDAITGDALTGATVKLNETGVIEFVQLDGSFLFKSLKPGEYTLIISHANYKTQEKKVSVLANKAVSLKVELQSESRELTNVILVTGSNGAERNTRLLERNSNQLVNIVSSRNIELLPDITVANVIQRVSGVTIEKTNSGEGRYPIIRGMEKRYINTLINGIKIPSPDNKNRFIPLDLFSSELLDRLEVSKSLTPSMEGDAIGGTINLVMKDAPSKKLLQVNFSAGYNNIFGKQDFQKFDNSTMNKQSPNEIHGSTYKASEQEFSLGHLKYTPVSMPVNTTFGLSIGNRFGKDKKMGVLFSGSFQDQYRGTNTTVFSTATTSNVDNIPAFEFLRERQYSLHSQRLGLTGKFDYKINNRNNISFFSTFVRLADFQVRLSNDTTNAINQTMSYSRRTSWQYQSIYNSTLQGLHKMSANMFVDWSAVFSIAQNAVPDLTSFSHGGLSVDRTGDKVKLSGDDILSGMSRSWEHNKDRDVSLYANFTKKLNFLRSDFEFKAGGLIRDKHRTNFYNAYSLNPLRILGANQLFTTIDNAQFTFLGSDSSAQLDGNNYTFTEDVAAGYIQGKWKLSSRMEALGGVRVERTHQEYRTEMPITADLRSGTISYTDWLPSLQFKYQLKPEQAFRLSYYKALSRPQFAELIPDGPNNYDLFKALGNPEGLEHSLADNFDLRYEFLPGKADQVLLGVFYKKVQDPIEISVRKQGYNTQVFKPVNIGSSATNYGFEAVFTKFFGALGITANYTFTHSSITNDSMLFKYRDPNIGITDKYVSETRPLQGQANHIGNFSLMYKNPKLGLDAQLAMVYTGERLAILNTYSGLHYWLEPTTNLDFSFEKRVWKKMTFYGKINNLTNTPAVTSIHQSYNLYLERTNVPLNLQTDPAKKIIVQKDYFKTSFLFGFRYKL